MRERKVEEKRQAQNHYALLCMAVGGWVRAWSHEATHARVEMKL